MMGRSHATAGLCAVTLGTAANVIPWDVPRVALATSILVVAGTVIPDIDHKNSSVSRSWGPLTWVMCRLARLVSRWVYLATRTPDDPEDRDPHRTLTHTWPGAVICGVATGFAMTYHPVASTVILAALGGTAARVLDKDFQGYAALGGGAVGWSVWPTLPTGGWMTMAIALAVGCYLHVATDCVTRSGAPLSFPRKTVKRKKAKRGGSITYKQYRWQMLGPPDWVRFVTGSWVERWLVRLMILCTLLGTYGLSLQV